MSIQSEIERINTNIQNSLNAVADQGVAVPENATSDNLAELIATIGNDCSITVSKSGTITTLTVTDKNGTQSVQIKDGADGKTPVKGTDYFTEADKSEITRMVIESLGGNPIFGYVDENNNIIVQGNLADGTYYVKYETDDETINIGNLVIDTNVYYSVTSTLTNCKNSNSTKEVVAGSAYSATITANDGYELKSVTVTMGGQSVSVNGGAINIANVTGNIVITAVAEEIAVAEPTNFCVVNGDGWISGGRCSSTGADRTDSPKCALTNYISVQNNDIVYVKNLDINTTTYSGLYKSDKTAIGGFQMPTSGALANYVKDVDLSGEWEQFTVDNADAGYVRICGYPSIVKNESEVNSFTDRYDINNLNIIINIKRNGEWL